MVDFPHLSSGNSSESSSRDLFAEFGVSAPKSPSSSNLSPSMAEAEPNPQVLHVTSIDSVGSSESILNVKADPAMDPAMQDNFKAAFLALDLVTHQNRVGLVDERKKTVNLMPISGSGPSSTEMGLAPLFSQKDRIEAGDGKEMIMEMNMEPGGNLIDLANGHQVFVESPLGKDQPSAAQSAPLNTVAVSAQLPKSWTNIVSNMPAKSVSRLLSPLFSINLFLLPRTLQLLSMFCLVLFEMKMTGLLYPVGKGNRMGRLSL